MIINDNLSAETKLKAPNLPVYQQCSKNSSSTLTKSTMCHKFCFRGTIAPALPGLSTVQSLCYPYPEPGENAMFITQTRCIADTQMEEDENTNLHYQVKH